MRVRKKKKKNLTFFVWQCLAPLETYWLRALFYLLLSSAMTTVGLAYASQGPD